MGSTKKAKSTKPPRKAIPSETAATRPPSDGPDPFNDVLLQIGEATSILALPSAQCRNWRIPTAQRSQRASMRTLLWSLRSDSKRCMRRARRSTERRSIEGWGHEFAACARAGHRALSHAVAWAEPGRIRSPSEHAPELPLGLRGRPEESTAFDARAHCGRPGDAPVHAVQDSREASTKRCLPVA